VVEFERCLRPIADLWVARGIAPAQIIATRESDTSVGRSLCPYPVRAAYAGSGSINAAASFRCVDAGFGRNVVPAKRYMQHLK
jgi:hypothetical protein